MELGSKKYSSEFPWQCGVLNKVRYVKKSTTEDIQMNKMSSWVFFFYRFLNFFAFRYFITVKLNLNFKVII